MTNPYANAFKKKDDDDEVKTPSQEASFQEKQKNNPYVSAFTKKKTPTFTPVEQPKQEEPKKQNLFQKVVEGAKKTISNVSESLSKKKDVGLKVDSTAKPSSTIPYSVDKALKKLPQEPLTNGPSIYDLASSKQSTSAQLTPEVQKDISEKNKLRSEKIEQTKQEFRVGIAQSYDEQLDEYKNNTKFGNKKDGSRGKYSSLLTAVDIGSQAAAGTGDIIAGTGQVLKWQGVDGMADKLIKKGGELQNFSSDTSEFDDGWDWKDAYNPRFYTTSMARGMPFTLAMMPLGYLGGAVAGAGAAAAGITGIAKIALTVVGHGFLSALAEGAYEGGSTYDEAYQEAIAKGKTPEEARQIADSMANKTMAGNTALLTATNSLQLIPFLGKPASEATEAVAKSGVFSKLMKGIFTAAGEFLSEGGEEVGQKQISLASQDKPLDFFSPATIQEFVKGGIQGLFFTAGGAIVDATGKDVTAQVVQNGIEQTKQIHHEIEQRVIEEVPEVATAIQEGKTQAEVDVVIEKHEEEVAKIAKEVILRKVKEEKQSQPQPVEAVEVDGGKQEDKEPVKEVKTPDVEPVKPTKTVTEVTEPTVTVEKVKALKEKARKTIGVEKPVELEKLNEKDTQLLKELKQSQIKNKRSDKGMGIEAFSVGEKAKGADGNTYEVIEFGRNKVGKDQRLSAKIKNIETGVITTEATAYSGVGRTMFTPVEKTKEPTYKVTTAEVIPTRQGVQTNVIKEETKDLVPSNKQTFTDAGNELKKVAENSKNLIDFTEKAIKLMRDNKDVDNFLTTAGYYFEEGAKAQGIVDENGNPERDITFAFTQFWDKNKQDTSKDAIIEQKEQDATEQTPTIRPERISDTGAVRQPDDRKQDTKPDADTTDDQTTSISEPGARPERIGKVGRVTINSEVEAILDSHDYSTNRSDYSNAEIAKLKQYTGAGGKESAGATGKGLLSEYYTPPEVTQKLWTIARTLVPDLNVIGKKALEPSIGIGSLLEGRPKSLSFVGYEYQKISGTIAQIVNNNTVVNIGNGQEFGNNGNFEKAPHNPDYDLVIGNPPFGERASFEKGKGNEPDINRWEEYFIKRGIDSLKDNGVLVYVVNSSFLKKSGSKGKAAIAKVGELVQAYRLPEGIFADTSIGTDIVVFKKTSGGDFIKNVTPLIGDFYFENNPDNIMGTVEERTNKFGQPETYVKGTLADIERINPVSEQEETVEVEKSTEVQKPKSKTEPSYAAKTIKHTRKLAKENKLPAVIKPDKKKVATVPKQTVFGGIVTANPVELKILEDTKVDGSVDYKAEAKDILNYEDGQYYHNLNYFSGDIYEKLEQLENDKATIIRDHGQKQYDKQLKGLESVKPKPLAISDIIFDPMDRFIKDLTIQKAENSYQKDQKLEQGFVNFLRTSRMPLSFRVDVYDVIRYVTNRRAAKGKKDLMGDIKNDANRLFNYYIRNVLDKSIQTEITDKYNREKNSFVNPDYSQFPVQIENMAKYFRKKEFNLSHTQASGVSMLTNKGVGLVAYGVGVGKTHTLLTATMVAKQRGWTKRPVFIVPKSTIENTWIGTIKSMFPNETIVNLGGLTQPDIKRLTKERGADPKKWIKDGEVAVLSHEGLLKIGLDEKQLQEAMIDLNDALSTAGGTERSVAKQQEKLTEIIGKAQSKAGNVALSDLGFDHLSVDEVHNFRKIFQGAKPESVSEDGTVDKSQTRRFGNVKIGGTPAKVAQQLFLIAQNVLRNNNNRGVYLASATPFENQATEVYNILSLVARNRLRKMGIQNINDFYSLFSNFETSLEKDAYGNFKDVEVMKSFKNLGELQRLIREFIDYKEDPSLVRPEKRVMTPMLQMSALQIENMEKIQEMLSPKEGQAEDGAVLKAIGHAKRNSISPYFINEWHRNQVTPEEFVENSPKVKFAMELLKSIKANSKTGDYGNFLYVGKENTNYNNSMADYAVRYLGYKKQEVGVIDGTVPVEDREIIKEKFRDGEIKLLIGGDPTKEGIDLQDNGYTTINIALGWNPTEMKQVEGRVWRQGNKRMIAPVIYPLLENSGDIFIYSKFEQKAGIINDLFAYAGKVFDVGEIDPKEKKLALMTAPEDKAKLEIEIDKAELEMKSMGLSTDILTLERLQAKIESLESSIQTNEQRIASGETAWGTPLSKEQITEYKKELAKSKANLKSNQDRLAEKNIENISDEMERMKSERQQFGIQIGKLEDTYSQRLTKFQKEYDEMIASRKTIADHVADFNEATKDLRELSQEEIDEKKIKLLRQIDEQNMLKNPSYVAPSGTGDVGGYADIEPSSETTTATIRSVQFPELVQMVKDLTGSAPTLKAFKTKLGQFQAKEDTAAIKLNPSIFNDPVVAGKVLSHEIGHLADWIPDGFMSRGNLLGRIASLNKYMYGAFEELSNKEIKKELKLLSQTWKPFNEQANKKFTSYRYSAKELYADAVSVLLNDPKLLQTAAPKFYNAFFEYIDKKPEFQKTYFDLMEELNKGEDYIFDQRIEKDLKGFKKGKEQRLQIEKDSHKKKTFEEQFKGTLRAIEKGHISDSIPLYRNLPGVGMVDSPAQRTREKMEELKMKKNEVFLYVDYMETEVARPLADVGISEDDFGLVLSLEREAFGDRQNLANPGGLIGKIPEQLLNYFYKKKNWSQEQISVFKQVKQKFHDRVFEETKRAAKNGNYSKELFKEKIEPNKDTYATFAIVHYINDNFISPDIKKMVGTMSEHENPFISTNLKTIALIDWNNTQEAKNISIDENMKVDPEGITLAEAKKDGTGRTIGFRKIKDREILVRMENGKRVGYNVDPYIKEFFDNKYTTPEEKHQLVRAIGAYNNYFKKFVTSWKPAFALFSNPIKDIRGTYVRLGAALDKYAPGGKRLSMFELLNDWRKAMPTGISIARGNVDALYKEMLQDKAITRTWLQEDPNNQNELDMDFLRRKYKFLGGASDSSPLTTSAKIRKVMLTPLRTFLNGIEFVGAVFEANTKIAGYQILKKRKVDAAKRGFLVRNYVGTPNYTESGSWKQIDNDVFVFSNVMIQGTRASIELMTDPKTAYGYWTRTFMTTVIPKMLMAAALAGLFGDELKKMYESMTNYDKRFYIPIPLGRDENGKVVYFRLPGDQIDNVLGAITWELLEAMVTDDPVEFDKMIAPLFSYIPDTSPILSQAADWKGYAQGRNPYDSYRGRLAIDQQTWDAGGYTRFKAMVQYSLNENGLTNFKTYDSGSQSTLEATIEKIPILNRMIKVSDYGIQEKYSSGDKARDREAAKKAIAKRELIAKYVKDSRNIEDPEELDEFKKQMVREYFGGLPTDDQMEEANRLSKKFMIDRERGESPYTDKLINSNTNAEKADLLMDYKEDMGKQEFIDFVNDNLRLKIISDDVRLRLEALEAKAPKETSMLPEQEQKTGFNFSLVKQAYAAEGLENTNRQLTWSKDTRTKWQKFLGKVAMLPGDQGEGENFKEPVEGITAEKLTDEQKKVYRTAMNYLYNHDREWYNENLGPKVERRILGKQIDMYTVVPKEGDLTPEEKQVQATEKLIKGVKSVAPKEAQEVIETYTPALDKELKDRKMKSNEILAYALATTEHEAGKAMVPVREGSASGFPNTNQGAIDAVTQMYNAGKISENYALPDKNGNSFYGRGYIQLTHKENYKTYGDAIGEDLVNNPDLALEPEIAAKILAEYFKRKGIDKLIDEDKITEARRKINPDKNAQVVNELYRKYLKAMQ